MFQINRQDRTSEEALVTQVSDYPVRLQNNGYKDAHMLRRRMNEQRENFNRDGKYKKALKEITELKNTVTVVKNREERISKL